jgi:hypothetical protein
VETAIRRVLLLVTMSVATMFTIIPTASTQEQLNCDDFPHQSAAQQILREDPSDPEGLDGPPGDEFTGIEGVACEDLPPPTDFNPVTGGQPPLLEAGGNLPSPHESATETASEAAGIGPFPWWSFAAILLSSGLLMFGVHRLITNR